MDHVCDGFAHGVELSRIGFSIRVEMQSSLILFVWPLSHQCFPFHLYVLFDIIHSHSVVTFNDGLIEDCYVCEDIWPVC